MPRESDLIPMDLALDISARYSFKSFKLIREPVVGTSELLVQEMNEIKIDIINKSLKALFIIIPPNRIIIYRKKEM